jgi:hypothetical protein
VEAGQLFLSHAYRPSEATTIGTSSTFHEYRPTQEDTNHTLTNLRAANQLALVIIADCRLPTQNKDSTCTCTPTKKFFSTCVIFENTTNHQLKTGHSSIANSLLAWTFVLPFNIVK